MASEDCKELLASGSQSKNAENDFYKDANINSTLNASENKGEALQSARDDDKEAEDMYATVASTVSEMGVENSTSTADGHEKEDELCEKNDDDDKVTGVNSSSNKETKKIARKRKKNTEEVSAQSVSPSPKLVKKKAIDTAAKMKEASPCNNPTESNEKRELKNDEKIESIATTAISEDGNEKKDLKVVEKAEGTENKAVKIVKKKLAAKARGESSNAESATNKSRSDAVLTDVPILEETAKYDDSSDEKSTPEKNASPVVEKDAENTEDKPTALATEKGVKKTDTTDKPSKKVDGMGLIFMCNANTKKDCFKYNVLGLPESKKELVAKVYKGMRLFLFDVDLKLLYGIFKAAGPGGYNIEPKAFRSKFPSQVRFTVLRDCLPLPEEKFKSAIEENYFRRNKFNCQLNPEQVKRLCKLFQSAMSGSLREANLLVSSRGRELKRRRVGREVFVPRPSRELRLSPPRRARYYPSPPPPSRGGLLIESLPIVPPPLLQVAAPYDYYYTRGQQRLTPRHRDSAAFDYHDSYALYREPLAYREPPAYPPPPAYVSRLHGRSPPRYPY